tara:strand:- start:7186 stop:8121 length:936 start_codon:yes stop_codon:yes gene_type:complete
MSQPIVQSFTGDRTNASTTSSTVINNITYPTGIVAGDLLFLVVSADAAPTLNGVPGTWTALGPWTNGTTTRLYAQYVVASGGETGTFTGLSWSVAAFGNYGFYRISNFNPLWPPEYELVPTTGTSTTPNPPSVTATWPLSAILGIAFYSQDDSRSTAVSGPSGWVVDYQGVSGPGSAGATGNAFGIAHLGENATGTTSPGVFTTSRSDTWVCMTFIIRGLELYTITETLLMSDASPVPNGVKVIALEADAVINANPGDTLIVRAADLVAGGAGLISLTVYSATDKLLIIDPESVSMAGETLATLPITPTPV